MTDTDYMVRAADQVEKLHRLIATLNKYGAGLLVADPVGASTALYGKPDPEFPTEPFRIPMLLEGILKHLSDILVLAYGMNINAPEPTLMEQVKSMVHQYDELMAMFGRENEIGQSNGIIH